MDVLIYLFLAALLIPVNLFIVKWRKSGQFPFFGSGILLAVFGVLVGFIIGAILVGLGNAGQGGAIMSAFVGLVIVANGFLYVAISVLLGIGRLLDKKNTTV
ncbi:hypothetical protein N781_16180 [Pontibacillus halophilus JSM 076056 = DSM 19796]|uniref:Uncharacterized protein n=1 Tax=Pontibacillus halophilus JSM 076056 = DSM 19796 TaxID=1385510 RepID=A0A0A5GMM9_9BACI|nr:hypothetical protein [Pontibacillus halophilus]KGX92478.1 hypothetical protein N781_16180 [Pontibacillus halophilus JSM 076056 = DSM 19796]